MSFAAQVEAFRDKVDQRRRDLFVNTVSAVKGSITDGSPITGAPGQPVDLGALKGSWQDQTIEDFLAQVVTNQEYAEAIEEGQQKPYTRADGTTVTPRAMTPRSQVGGFHSVKQTRANYEMLVEDEARKLSAADGPMVLRYSLEARRR